MATRCPECLSPGGGDPRWSPPLDVRDLVVRLETEGVTDAVARSEYGYANCWEMAEAEFARTQPRHWEPPERQGAKRVQGCAEYFRGLAFALPLLMACASNLVLKYSIWGGPLSSELATAVGIGTVSSFILCGGFVQGMARTGLFYGGSGQFRVCAASTWNWARWGMMGALAVAASCVALSLFYGLLPPVLNAVAAGFFLSQSLFWLGTGALHMLDRNLQAAAAVAIGIAVVFGLHSGLAVPLVPAQIAAVLAAALYAGAIAAFVLRRNARKDEARRRPPRRARLVYDLWPYFLYGTLYYVFMFADRVLAWTAHTGSTAFAVFFRGDYELAQNIGLCGFVVQVGWTRYALHRYHRAVAATQRSLTVAGTAECNRAVLGFYGRITAAFLPVALLSAAGVAIAADRLGIAAQPQVWRTALWALAGYALLVVALWNTSLLFVLSRPLRVVAAAGWACAANVAAGYVCSRLGSYELAIAGFAFGSAVFAALSSAYVVRTIRRFDYFHYASAL